MHGDEAEAGREPAAQRPQRGLTRRRAAKSHAEGRGPVGCAAPDEDVDVEAEDGRVEAPVEGRFDHLPALGRISGHQRVGKEMERRRSTRRVAGLWADLARGDGLLEEAQEARIGLASRTCFSIQR